jgi:hypothetical protein
MRTEAHRGQGKEQWTRFSGLIAAFVLASPCYAQDMTCDGAANLETVRRETEKYFSVNGLHFEATTDEIRTLEATDRRAVCSAKIALLRLARPAHTKTPDQLIEEARIMAERCRANPAECARPWVPPPPPYAVFVEIYTLDLLPDNTVRVSVYKP